MTDSFRPPASEDPSRSPETGESSADSTGDPSGGRRPKKTTWIVAAAVIVVAGVAGIWLGTSQRGSGPDDGPGLPADVESPDDVADADDTLPEDAERSEAELYFAGEDGRLYAERRELPVGTPAERAQSLVEALLAGPEGGASSGLRGPLPPGSRVEAVYLLGTTALLDLRPPEPESANPDEPESIGPPTPAQARLRKLSYGSKQELLEIYSLVNTVVLGVEGVDTVQLLWDGRQPETFAGHVDTTRPLAADPSYLASR